MWRSAPPPSADGPDSAAPARRTRVLRVIARMNVGGPAYHVSLLTGQLDPDRYESLLLCGTVGPGEASLSDVADTYGARYRIVPGLRPEISPWHDARALGALIREIRAFQPDIVHTHTAKAGMLGRIAALIAAPHAAVVHTFHGHVLIG